MGMEVLLVQRTGQGVCTSVRARIRQYSSPGEGPGLALHGPACWAVHHASKKLQAS
jgi:hypothetical protein